MKETAYIRWTDDERGLIFNRINSIMGSPGQVGFLAALKIAVDLELPLSRHIPNLTDAQVVRLKGQFFDWLQEKKECEEPAPSQLEELANMMNNILTVSLDASSPQAFLDSLTRQVRLTPRTFFDGIEGPMLSVAVDNSKPREHRTKILIIGMKQKYQLAVDAACRGKADITFLYADAGGRIDRKRLKGLASSSDKVIIMPWIDHSTVEFLMSSMPAGNRPVSLGARGINSLINYITAYLHTVQPVDTSSSKSA